jgi:hypothetical protein
MLVWKTDIFHVDRLYDAVYASVVLRKCLWIYRKTYSRINPSNSSDESLFISAFSSFLPTASLAALGESVGAAVRQGIRSQVNKQLVHMPANFHD